MSIKAIILDIDGTLSPEFSWLSLTRDLGASVEEHVRIYEDYRSDRISYSESRKQLISLWRSTGNANRPYLEKVFMKWPLVDQAESTVKWLKSHFTVCLITGSVDLYAETVAKRLSIRNWYANTELRWHHEQLISYEYHLDQGARKLDQLRAFCEKQHLHPTQCSAVGDSENDLRLFDASGRGVLINADGHASGELKQHAWRTIGSFRELPEIFEPVA